MQLPIMLLLLVVGQQLSLPALTTPRAHGVAAGCSTWPLNSSHHHAHRHTRCEITCDGYTPAVVVRAVRTTQGTNRLQCGTCHLVRAALPIAPNHMQAKATLHVQSLRAAGVGENSMGG